MDWLYDKRRDAYVNPYCTMCVTDKYISAKGKMHLHYNNEILYAVKKTLLLTLFGADGSEYDITIYPGEFAVIGSNILHRTIRPMESEYLLCFIPPDCLLPPLKIHIGTTFSQAFPDTENHVRELLVCMKEYSSETVTPDPVRASLLNSLGNSVTALILPHIADKEMKIKPALYVADIFQYIYRNFNSHDLTLKAVSSAFGYSEDKLSEIFCRETGTGVKRYIDNLRINDAKIRLMNGSTTVEAVAIEVGYDCTRTFFRVFKSHTGMTPTEFRNLMINEKSTV